MVEELVEDERQTAEELFPVTVDEARFKRDDASGLPALQWQLRTGGGEIIWHLQVYREEELDAIRRNLALCNIVGAQADLPEQLVKAKDCVLEVRRVSGNITFVRRLDDGVFTGEISKQDVAGEIPL